MRDPKRIDGLLSRLKASWLVQSDMRLGQLLEAAAQLDGAELFYVEDEELLRKLERLVGGAPGIKREPAQDAHAQAHVHAQAPRGSRMRPRGSRA